MEGTLKIHALPGMGADKRMFPAPWTSIPDFVAHDWGCYSGETTLAELAASMCSAGDIRDGDVLIGASLGGMVACEIAKIRDIRTLFLIGSAAHQQEIRTLLRLLHPLAQIAPLDWLRSAAGKLPQEVAQMFADAEPEFIRSMCAAIFAWEGLGASEVDMVRIHGRHDLVIPAPGQTQLLLDGGHLLSMTHAEACTDFIRARIAGGASLTGCPKHVTIA